MSRDHLSGSEMQQLTQALLSAFDSDGLERLVRFHLNQDLAAITDAKNLQDAAFDLVRWAIRNGELPTLVEAAFAENAKNPMLMAFRQEVWDASPTGAFAAEPDESESPVKPVRDETRIGARRPSEEQGPGSGQSASTATPMMSRGVALPLVGLIGLVIGVVLLFRPWDDGPGPVVTPTTNPSIPFATPTVGQEGINQTVPTQTIALPTSTATLTQNSPTPVATTTAIAGAPTAPATPGEETMLGEVHIVDTDGQRLDRAGLPVSIPWKGKVTLVAQVNGEGANDATWSADSPIVDLDPKEGPQVTVTGINCGSVNVLATVGTSSVKVLVVVGTERAFICP